MNVLHEIGLGIATVMPEPVVTAVAGAVGAVGIMGFALVHVLGRRRMSLVR